MIRITTRIGQSGRVRTLFFNGKWITFAYRWGKQIASWDTESFQIAGENHLLALNYFKDKEDAPKA